MTDRSSARIHHAPGPRPLAVLLVVASVVGFISALALTMDKLQLIEHPGTALNCNISALVGCGPGLVSWQGSLLGFPNSIIGMAAWAALLAVGVILLTRSELTRLVWLGLNVALLGAFALVVFLLAQSIYVLGVLCPWCMATWAVTIPSFLAVSFYNARQWGRPQWLRVTGGIGLRWLPLITLGCFVAVAIAAQLRLDLLQSI